MMESEYVIKVVAWLFSIIGAAGVIAGLLGFFGPALVGFSPWILTIGGFLFVLSGYGLMNKDLDEV